VTYLLAQASAHRLPLRNESVQTCVTSPPYWGLRSYAGEQREEWGGDPQHEHEFVSYARQDERYTGKRKWQHIGAEAQAAGVKVRDVDPNAWGHPQTQQESRCACGTWYGALGLEPTPELYVEHMVEVFREVRRVLRRDGTLWLNLGDSYTSGGRANYDQAAPNHGAMSNVEGRPSLPAGLKPKDLVGIPWRVAFALQADGWYLRSDIVWSKPNPMPESVTDRPTKSHEYLFLLAKSERYFYDAEAIKEPLESSSIQRLQQKNFDNQTGGPKDYGPDSNRSARRALVNLKGRAIPPQVSASPAQYANLTGRNARSVWQIATQPYPGAHFATFPEELPERCIKAGSAAQACSVCGAPWERQTEVQRERLRPRALEDHARLANATPQGGYRGSMTVSTTGFAPTCTHEAPTVGSVVLDPFNGSGTTGAVALRLGRRYVGLDLSREYLTEQALRRIDPIAAEAQDFRNGVDGAQAVMSL
jgi:DNA modification methylase